MFVAGSIPRLGRVDDGTANLDFEPEEQRRKLSLSLARPTVAMHDMTGVKRAWRGRGIAGALKRAEIAWAKENGYTRLETQNEERNEPILRLNERHGYVVEPGAVTVRGPLA